MNDETAFNWTLIQIWIALICANLLAFIYDGDLVLPVIVSDFAIAGVNIYTGYKIIRRK